MFGRRIINVEGHPFATVGLKGLEYRWPPLCPISPHWDDAQLFELSDHFLGLVYALVELAGLTPFCRVIDVNARTLREKRLLPLG